ncbi:unnamed protein product [Penicillium egyptiacum]|uniref:Uncharacterized protein n=1 Tax=Penicillium egyptiacum TaxID=1303716 RepID=A0A9W4P2R0_9EURO|nr:unnamed protein product [Penicillium egyptiacum]
MAALGDRVMPLSLTELTAPAEEDNRMKRCGAYSIRRAEKRQLEILEKEGRRSKRSDKRDKKSRWNERKVDDEIADLQRDVHDMKERMQYSDTRQPNQARTGRELQRELKGSERKLAQLEKDREYNASRTSGKEERRQARRDGKKVKKVKKLHCLGDEEHDLDWEDE